MFRRAPSRGGRRVAVNFVVCFGWGEFSRFFFFERTRPAASMRSPCPIYLSTSTGVRTGCHYLISLSVCAGLRVAFVVRTDCESCTRPISTNPGSMKAAEYFANAWDVFFLAPSRDGRGRPAAAAFVVCSGWRGFFRVFVSSTFFVVRTHTACCNCEAALTYLPLYYLRILP